MAFRYTFTLSAVDLEQLSNEIVSTGVPGFTPLQLGGSEGGTVWIDFTTLLTSAQLNTVSNKVALHIPDPANLLKRNRAASSLVFGQADSNGAIPRAIILTALDEINSLRARLRAQDAAIAAATSLADLKTRWAALAAMPDRTPQQAKSAVTAKIDSGGAD